METMPIISLADARAQGLTRYFTGTPCVRGHVAPRRVKNRLCTACENEKSTERYRALARDDPRVLARRKKAREWAIANHDRYRERQRRYRAKNAEKLRKYRQTRRAKEQEAERQRAKKDPDYHRKKHDRRKNKPEYKAKARERSRRYRKERPDKAREAVKRWMREHPEEMRKLRQARALARRAAGKVSVRTIRAIRARKHCAACGQRHAHMEIDHIVAVTRGGTNDPSNLQLLCRPCNRSKWAHDFETWLSGLIL